MKTLLHNVLKATVLLLIPLLGYGQAPNLGSTSSFALFTAVGAFNNSGVSTITGDIGTNVGAFNLGAAVLIGSSHVADAVSAQAATDMDLAYGSLSPVTCDSVIGTTMGGGQILPPNVYCLGAASTINGDLILDGQGDPNSLFIFKIDGALATSVGSRILLTNSASLCNVYFQINGQVTLGENSLFQGTILANGAIHLLNNATLIGRGLSRSGAINLSANTVTGALPLASTITAGGATTLCGGGSVTLSGNVGGTWNTGAITPTIIVSTSGDYFVTNEAACDTVSSNHIIVTVNPLPIPSVISANGPTSFCEGGSVELTGNVGGTWSTGAITPSIIVTTAGDYFVTNVNACGDTVSNHILVNIDQSQPIASIITISGPNLLCAGDSVVLSGNVGGTWSTGATTPSIIVKTSGDYFVTNSNGCGDVVSNHIIVSVNNVDAGEIGSNQNLCVGAPAPTLTATTAATGSGLLSYVWQFSTMGCSGPWSSIDNSNSLSFNPGGTVSVTTYYRLIVASTIDDGDGGEFVCSDTSNCVVITANVVDAGSLISDVDSICAGGSVAIDSIGTLGTLTYFVFTNGLVAASFNTLAQVEDYLSAATPGEYCIYTIAYAGLNGSCGNVAGLTLADVIAACLAGQCYDISEPLCIQVTAPPVGAIALQGPAESCEDDGSVIQVVLSAAGFAAPYDFYYSDIITSVGSDCLPRAVGGAFVVLNEADSSLVLTYTGANAGTYTITLNQVVDANGCADTTRRSVTFTIAAKPIGKDSSRTINNCTPVNINLQNIIACQQASTFTWYSVASIGSSLAYNNPNVSGETINPVGAGSVITDFLSNTSTVNQTIIYRVVPTSIVGPCVGEPFYISITVRPRVLVTCLACVSQVNVSLDANCRFLVTPNVVLDGFAQCENGQVLLSALEVLISDGNNDSYINCAGTYTYVVRLKAEYLECFTFEPCWGKITAEDKTAPALICAPADVTLDCYDVNYVLNNRLTIGNVGATSSPRPAATGSQTINNAEGVAGTGDNCNLGLAPPSVVADVVKNLGYAYFRDNCYNCGCRITLKWTDKVVFYSCTDMEANGGIYATISREWVATDCNGMSTSYVQRINFTRPAIDDFVFNGPGEGNYDRVVTYNACTPDKSLIKKADVTPYICSYFNTSANPRCLFIDEVECNYSISIKDTEFPICGGKGVKIDREIYVFDWCAGGIVDTFHVLIKIGDFEAPSVDYAHGAPFDISTGPMDCTAAIPVTVAGIKSAFGVTIKDNCTLGNISVSVYTKDRYVKGILVYEGPEDPFCDNAHKGAELRGENDAYRLGACDKADICWDKVEYAVMNGMMIGLPVGKHLMVIDAFDACYAASTTCFIFEVKDKIAPVMKCDDDLHVTLSNANGYTNGYAQVSAEDIDEGSWDNCKLAWIAVRRNVPDACAASFIAKGYDTNGNGKLDALPADGDVSKADGFDLNGDGDIADFGETFILKGGKLMTPLLDYVEFFCCDLTERVTVELWGGDIYGNTNYCWMDLLIEDKVAPTCIAPWAITIDCDDKNIALIDDKVASAAAFGDVTINTGNDCGALDTTYTTVKSLKCGAGYIDRIWTLTKQTVKGPIAITCTQRITVNPVHEYNICFPKDVSTDCKTPIIDTVITDELACDILAVNVSDKRYDASDDECYKIFRTYSVINWCTYDDRCGDPLLQTNISIIPRDVFGNYGKAPIYVLVRDRERGVRDGIEEFYISKDLIHANADDIRFTPPYCSVAGEFYHSFIYTQIIKVYDDTRPVVTGDPAKFCIREGGDCLANLKMVITGKDNCTDLVTLETQFLMIAPGQTLDASKMILYSTPRWSTKDLGNGQFEINVSNLPQGKHDLIVVVRDECGNLSVATRIPFTVEDCKGPAPICINGLSTDLMPDGNNGGMMAVWASDFVASKVYDCNGQGPETLNGLKLVTKYSLNRVGDPVDKSKTGLNLTCADKGKVVLVELHAWDEAGNNDFCVTYVEVQDNRAVCPGVGSGATASVAGTIATEGNANLQGATITLSGAASKSSTTAANGGYSFISLTKGADFTVTPQLDKNHLNGVSTFDLVLIQKHILNVQALNSPYKMIAADVNNSKSITTLDLIALRKLILNIDQSFANNTSWRFVDASYNFPTPSNPWAAAFPEVVNINDIAANVTANFVAIKVGDVNASATVSAAAGAEVRTAGTLDINAADAALKAGQEYNVEFNAADLKDIQGYQFSLNLDKSKVELVDIVYGVAKAENFGVFQSEGVITTSWNQAGLATATAKQGALFTLVLRAKADAQLSNALSLNRVVSAEAYNQNNEQLGVALQFGKADAIANGFELKQNTPNPFNGETVINFNLPKAAAATLTISDVTGRVLKSIRADYAKGANQVVLKASDFNATGVLYYTLEAEDFTATKKMVLLK